MAIYGIADLHLSLGTKNKEMDIFGEVWQNHTRKILDNWQKLVSKDDTVIIAGDISWALGLENSLMDLAFINNLNGNKIILKGNHDYWWETITKMNNFIKKSNLDSIQFLHNNAIEIDDIVISGTRGWTIPEKITDDEDTKISQREKMRLELSLQYAKKLKNDKEIIVFMHYPPVIKNNDNIELISLMKQYGVCSCYYGHIHGKKSEKAVTGDFFGINLHLISCDYINFTPILIKK